MVNTVFGAIEASALGFCQPHEHLYVSASPATERYPALLADDLAKSALEAADFARAGGCSIIDAQPVGAGGDPWALREIARRADIHVIATCGYHLPIFYPSDHWVFSRDQGALYARFADALANGYEGVPIGAVKIALTKEGVDYEAFPRFVAAGRAAAGAGVPVIMHTELGAGAAEAVHQLEDLGVPARRIAVCHVDRQAEDDAPHLAVAETGAMLEYDTIGRFKYHDDEREVALIQRMLERGYGDQLMLSLDTTSQRMLRYGGEIGLPYLIDTFLPLLRARGVSGREIARMTVGNPASLFD